MPTRISRPDYAAMYGPTPGDRVRLGDTDLIIEVERDFTKFGTISNCGASRKVTST